MAVPFLLIGPDARAGGMGDAGVASSPDANSTHWNPAKLAFIKDTLGFSISYMPWLSQLLPDINFANLSGFYKLNDRQTLGVSLRYFSLGSYSSGSGARTSGKFNPNEYAADFSYARQLSDNWSVAMSARYIYSNLNGAAFIQGTHSYPGRSFGIDISGYYKSGNLMFFGRNSTISAGASISNIGPKIKYNDTATSLFLPANLRIGPSFSIDIDKTNKLTFLFDLNKLLVPTPPAYPTNSSGSPILLPGGGYQILAGKNPNVSVPQGIIQSFYDAPGGFREELREIDISGGIEYWYDNQFALRVGYFYENPTKGGREFYTIGAGFKLKIISIDASYFIPVSTENPLRNTLQITLNFNFH